MECPQTETLDQPGLFERLKATGKRIPLSGSLEVTFRCNLRCVHCYIGDNRSGVPEKKELTKEEIFGILDQVTDAGTLWFLLTGGEPFLRPDFMDIYRYAAHKGLILTIFTNGTLLSTRIIDELADLPPVSMEITLYGATKGTYERITGIPGSYERCMRNVDLLLDSGIPIKLKTIMMKWNVHEFEGIKCIAESKGVSFHYDPMLFGSLDVENSPHQHRLTPEEVVALEKPNTVLQTELKILHEKHKTTFINNQALYVCGAALNTYHIDPCGQLSPCILSRGQNYDLKQGNFHEGWYDFLGRARLLKGKNRDQCNGCNLLILCRQCPGKSYLEYGNLDEPVDFFCQVGKLRGKALIDKSK